MNTSNLVATALLVTIAVTGCSATAEPRGILGALDRLKVGPNYERPATQLPERFRGQDAADPASLADLPWWHVFGDPALQRLIREALENNYDLEAAIARVEQFRARVGVAASELYPQVGYGGSAARAKRSCPSSDPRETARRTSSRASSTWPGKSTSGAAFAGRRKPRARSFSPAGTFVARVMLSLVSNVASGYFRLLELDRQREIARSSAETYQQTLDLFTQRFEGGKDTKLSTSRAEASLAASLATIARLDQAIVQQENAISELLGAPPRPIERGNPLTAQSPPAAPLGLTSDLLQRRPDILRAEHEMVSANAEIGVAVANFFPRIGLTALYGGQSDEIENVIKNNFSIWNIAGSVSGPIFQGGRLLEQYRARRAFWDETIAAYRGTIVQALREVSDALAAQSKLVERRAAEERQVKALTQAVELSLDRYRTGLASYFEVLEAQQELYPAEDALAQSQRDQLLTVVDLYKALGGGWNLADDAWTAMR